MQERRQKHSKGETLTEFHSMSQSQATPVVPNALGGLGGFGARGSIGGRSSIASAVGRNSMRSVIEKPPEVAREEPEECAKKLAKRASFAEEVECWEAGEIKAFRRRKVPSCADLR